jgi:hypothetical protein
MDMAVRASRCWIGVKTYSTRRPDVFEGRPAATRLIAFEVTTDAIRHG